MSLFPFLNSQGKNRHIRTSEGKVASKELPSALDGVKKKLQQEESAQTDDTIPVPEEDVD